MNAPKVKITKIGNSLGVVLPKETLALLNVDKGDELTMIRTPNGIELTPYDPEVARQLEEGRRIMRENRDVLRELAK